MLFVYDVEAAPSCTNIAFGSFYGLKSVVTAFVAGSVGEVSLLTLVVKVKGTVVQMGALLLKESLRC